MITILSDDKMQRVGNRILEQIRSKGEDIEYISVSDLDIKPCYGCGSCSTKTYGKCVLQDDMEPILRKLIRTDRLVLVTPVTWGSYSSAIKRIMDRISVIGDSHYYVVKKELVKGVRGNLKKMFAVGVKEDCDEVERSAFQELLQENIHIMNIGGEAFISSENGDIKRLVEEICQ